MERGALFQYNTSIVDLNPFEKRDNRLRTPPTFIPRTPHALGVIDTRFRSENSLMLSKIMSQKKFLVNKNIRFYEPIKDAEILANIDSLRSKLLPTQAQGEEAPPSLQLIHNDRLG